MTEDTPASSDDSHQLKDLGHIAAAVGHHVINAFSAVVSNAELIRSQANDPSCRPREMITLASAIVDNALGASHVARRLIDWTRKVTSLDYEQTSRVPEMIDLNQVIQEAIELHKTPEYARIEWKHDPRTIPHIRGDRSQLVTMLTHLIRNSRESLPSGTGKIGFSTRCDNRNWVILEIWDSGSGMSSEILKRATEPFFTTKPGRSGVGLTIAHGIWRRHRGALSIESHSAQGTTVRLAIEPPQLSGDTTPSYLRALSQPSPISTEAQDGGRSNPFS
jgi:two-component system, NtrC family, sensor kinase